MSSFGIGRPRPFVAMPDAELVAITALQAAGFVHVSSSYDGQVPYDIAVSRIGGTPAIDFVVDSARLQVDVWAVSKKVARDTAATALAALGNLQGTRTTLASISAVETDLGLSWQPDTQGTPAIPRYLFGVVLTLRPA